MTGKVEAAPVIRAGPPEPAVAEDESQRPDQVEARSGGRAGPGDIARVLRNLRRDKDDVEKGGNGYRVSL